MNGRAGLAIDLAHGVTVPLFAEEEYFDIDGKKVPFNEIPTHLRDPWATLVVLKGMIGMVDGEPELFDPEVEPWQKDEEEPVPVPGELIIYGRGVVAIARALI